MGVAKLSDHRRDGQMDDANSWIHVHTFVIIKVKDYIPHVHLMELKIMKSDNCREEADATAFQDRREGFVEMQTWHL